MAVLSLTNPYSLSLPPCLITSIDQLNARSQGYLPGLIGIEFLTMEPGRLTSRLLLRPELLAPNGYLHAAVIIALADTACVARRVHSGRTTQAQVWDAEVTDAPRGAPQKPAGKQLLCFRARD